MENEGKSASAQKRTEERKIGPTANSQQHAKEIPFIDTLSLFLGRGKSGRGARCRKKA